MESISSPMARTVMQRRAPTHLEDANLNNRVIKQEITDNFSPVGDHLNSDKKPMIVLGSCSTRAEQISKRGRPEIEDLNMDPKRMKRLIANREYARRSWLRKQELIEKLRKDKELEEFKVGMMTPQYFRCKAECQKLMIENSELRMKMKMLECHIAYQDAASKALKDQNNTMRQTLYMMFAKKYTQHPQHFSYVLFPFPPRDSDF